jgi:protocatechuate 3,4-dioxygenase, beta subunit
LEENPSTRRLIIINFLERTKFMNKEPENRREFIKRASLAALALPLLINCKSDSLAQKAESELSLIKKNALASGGEWSGAIDAPETIRWKTVLAKETDRGEPLLISGTIFQSDGKTPAPGVLIYLYHTDMEGIYGRGGEHRHGRYRGWMLTDGRGRFEFRTIKPASYPNSTVSSHIHMTLTGKSFREDWVDSILFEGDRYITAQERRRLPQRGGFNPILQLEKGADGILRGTRDIRLWQA